MFEIPDFIMTNLNEASPIGDIPCDVFMTVVEFIFY